MDYNLLWKLSYECLQELASQEIITASAKHEAYGCLFGRDSAITILKILSAHRQKPTPQLLEASKKTLLTLVELQGREHNIESGEEPGKFIHEFRRDNYDKLINRPKPWYVYPDGILRNYDSLDATPLILITIYRYWETTHDDAFLLKVMPAVEKGLNWIITYADSDKDYLLEYKLPVERKHGGLPVQSWTDSHDCLQLPNGTFPQYPIAPVEVQGYVWLTLKLWASYYNNIEQTNSHSKKFSQSLLSFAEKLKKRFNESFFYKNKGLTFPAQALDGYKNKIKTVTGNALLLLWASFKNGATTEAIIEPSIISSIVERSFKNDLFNTNGGIRTMSTLSPTFNPNQNSYHNGSFWPKLNGMAYEGLRNWKYYKHAEVLKTAALKPILYFNSPIELYMADEEGNYKEYVSKWGKLGCRKQAWSAAAILDMTSAGIQTEQNS